jgi:hypothetical protein
MVVDADNKRLGQVIAQEDSDAVVYFTINGRAVLLAVGQREILALGDFPDVAFAAPDCSGQGFLTEEGGISSQVAVVASGNTSIFPCLGGVPNPLCGDRRCREDFAVDSGSASETTLPSKAAESRRRRS